MVDVKKLIDIADENIEYLLSSLSIDYRREGNWLAMNCMFHEDADGWNLKYNNKSFYCFSQCKRNFSIINVVEKVLDVDFLEAVKWLCNELKIKDDSLVVEKENVAVKSKLKRLKALRHKSNAVDYIPVGQEVLNSIERYNHPYMLKQGFKKSTLEHFNIGYARYGKLEGRITFPIDSPEGDIVSISGRIPTDEKLDIPKYMVLGDTNKSSTLYNISRIDPNDNYIIVVEGFMTVLDMYEYGLKSVVAVIGSSLSVQQKNILLRLGRKIIVIADNDDAGKRLNQQVYNLCYRFCDVTIVNLSDFTDVDKASPRTLDIGFDKMTELVDYLEVII